MEYVIAFVWIGCLILCTYIGMRRGFPFLGFLNGLVLGPLGVLIVVIQKDSTRRDCPYCAEMIKVEARVCPFCRNEIV